MASREAFFEFELTDNGGLKRFWSPEDVVNFVAAQQATYGWLNDEAIRNLGHFNNLTAAILNGLGNVLSVTRGVAAGSNNKDQLTHHFREAFVIRPIPVAGTPTAKFIEELRQAEGPSVAAAALAFFSNHLPTVSRDNPQVLQGIIAAANFRSGVHPKTLPAARRALNDLAQQFEDTLTATEASLQVEQEQNALARSRNRSEGRRVVLNVAKKLQTFRSVKKVEIDQAISELRAVQKSFQEFMRIKAPVDYWRDKADRHRMKAKAYRRTLVWLASVGGFVIVGGLYKLSTIATSTAMADKIQPAFYVYVSMGLFVTTVLFWAARVLVRLFMSEHHLSIDAEERETMAMTYLALTEKGSAEEKDRHIVLGALFRPTSDGIVKDDAAPDISLPSLISKGLSKP